MKKPLIITIIILLAVILIGGISAAYYLFMRPLSASDLYEKAIANAISQDESERPYGAFTLNSENVRVEGEFKGSPSGKDAEMAADLTLDVEESGVPLKITAEARTIREGDKDPDSYVRYTEVDSTNATFGALIKQYFQPAINKWVKTDQPEDTASSYKTDGPLAAITALGLFAPITSLSADDQKVFLDVMKKHGVYTVNDDVEEVTYKDQKAKRLTVTISKEAFEKANIELGERLSDAAEYEVLTKQYIDATFGKDNLLLGKVYINEGREIIGTEMTINLAEEIKDESFGSSFETIDVSLSIDYDKEFDVKVPENAISQDELNELLGSGQ